MLIPAELFTASTIFGGAAGQYELGKLAKSIQSELVKTIQRRDIGVLQSPFAVLKYTRFLVLAETVYIHYEEEKLLADPEFRQKVVGIAQTSKLLHIKINIKVYKNLFMKKLIFSFFFRVIIP